MSGSLSDPVSDPVRRISAIVRTDLRIRSRRMSTLVSFLAICFLAYLWVPDPKSGMALMVVEGQRAFYNSEAMALATALLGSLCFGLFGYYLVSHSLTLDARTRCGFVIASTPVRNGEYLLAKLLGNVCFLMLLAVGYMASSMAMQLVRGATPIEPRIYLVQYGLLLPAMIFFISAVAILFESLPFLSGKLGDVVYFFFWGSLLIVPVIVSLTGAAGTLASYFDITGMALALQQLTAQTGSTEVSIGATRFDPAAGVFIFENMTLPPGWLAGRLVSLFAWVPVFLLAVAAFHRFDPARRTGAAKAQRRGYLQPLNRLVRPLVGAVVRVARSNTKGSRPSFLRAATTDASLTLLLNPVVTVVLAGLAVVAAVIPVSAYSWLLPLVYALIGMMIAGVSRSYGRKLCMR